MLAHRWQTVPEKGVVGSRELFKFWCAPTISPEGMKLESSNVACQWSLFVRFKRQKPV